MSEKTISIAVTQFAIGKNFCSDVFIEGNVL